MKPYEETIINDIKTELKPILDFIQIRYIDTEFHSIALKQNLTFKEFNNYFPDITQTQLIKLFDFVQDNKYLSFLAIEEIINEDKNFFNGKDLYTWRENRGGWC